MDAPPIPYVCTEADVNVVYSTMGEGPADLAK